MKRRAFLQTSTATLLTAAGLAPRSPSPAHHLPRAADTHATTRILLIGHKPDHPPGSHLYLEECTLLAHCLNQTEGVEAAVSDGWPAQASELDKLDAVVLYSSPGAELLFAADHADQAAALLDRGVGLTCLHWATGIGDSKNSALAERMLNQLGGLFGVDWSGLDVSDSRVVQALPDHPISRGWSDFDLKDEWYLDLRFNPRAQPLATVQVKDKSQVVAWCFERDNANGGRSFGNSLGHFHENFLINPFRQWIVNGILWTAHRDIPPTGAPCVLADPQP